MQCENGYVKPGVKGILCRKCEEPKAGDMRSVAHAFCGHQRFCPNAGCYTFLPSWEKCTKRQQKPVEAAGEEIAPKAVKSTAKKKRAKKAAE